MAAKCIALMAGFGLALTSCSDHNTLTEDTISKVVAEKVRLNPCVQFYGDGPLFAEAYVNGNSVEMQDFLLNYEPFPVTIRVGGFDNFISPRFQEFETAGLLESKMESKQSGMLGGPVEFRTYNLTALGQSLYQVGEKKVFRDRPARKNPLFCAGKGQVSEIVNFVIPAEGANTTRATFRWNTVDENGNSFSILPERPWASIGSFNSDRLQLEGVGTATLTLTNNGWELLE